MKVFLTTVYFVVSFYVFGCLILENDVNYLTWYQLDGRVFLAYHRTLESYLKPFMFAPMGLQLLINGLLIWLHPPTLSQRVLILTFLLNGYITAESLLVQVPIHQALERHFTTERLDDLLWHHHLFRLPAELLVAGSTGYLLYRILKGKLVES